jgi:hypothetical protein
MNVFADCNNSMVFDHYCSHITLEPGGKCITLAWNSQGTGKGLGFEITRILLVAHGGNRNDTIVTVDRKSIKVKN